MPLQLDQLEESKPQITPEDALVRLKEAYGDIVSILREYCDLQEEYYHILAYWIIGTYLHDTFSTYPYLFVHAMRGSGKTRLLKLLAAMCRNGEIQANISEAVLFRTAKGGTIIIDEFEHIGSKEKGILRELLNAGYKKGIKVKRMQKRRSEKGDDEMVVQEFDLFTPIVMANIWGMEEVLSDRCLTLIIEKSNRKDIVKLIEDFHRNPRIARIKKELSELNVVICNVVTEKNIEERWNNYIRQCYCNNNYTTTLSTVTTFNYITTEEEKEIFQKIDSTGIEGRHLELFFPLFTIGRVLGKENLDQILTIAKHLTSERKTEEYVESKDVLLFNFIGRNCPISWHNTPVLVSEVTSKFKEFVGTPEDELDWLNSKWMGRALKRLRLFKLKNRVPKGIEVVLDIQKAQDKMVLFKEEWDGVERRKDIIPVEKDRRKSVVTLK